MGSTDLKNLTIDLACIGNSVGFIVLVSNIIEGDLHSTK